MADMLQYRRQQPIPGTRGVTSSLRHTLLQLVGGLKALQLRDWNYSNIEKSDQSHGNRHGQTSRIVIHVVVRDLGSNVFYIVFVISLVRVCSMHAVHFPRRC